MGIIYKALTPCGLVYIGQSIKPLELRRAEHYKLAETGVNTPFAIALRKYDDAVIFSVLENVPNIWLDKHEYAAIQKHECLYPMGLNVKVPGDNGVKIFRRLMRRGMKKELAADTAFWIVNRHAKERGDNYAVKCKNCGAKYFLPDYEWDDGFCIDCAEPPF